MPFEAEYIDIFTAITALSFLLSMFSQYIYSYKKTKGWQLALKLIGSIILLCLLGIILVFLIVLLAKAMDQTSNGNILVTLGYFGATFLFMSLMVHLLGYCLSGFLYLLPPQNKFWPKGIDYIYYFAGFLLLGLLVVRADGNKPLIGHQYEIIFGMFLLSLKLFKTSSEIFPDKFIENKVLFRIPYVGPVILKSELVNTTILYRSIGQEEYDFIEETGFGWWPSRDQPLFYSVTNIRYARDIATKWNVKKTGIGYVTKFGVRTEFLSKYEVKNVGDLHHNEWQIPVRDLSELNKNIVGLIKVVDEYRI